jgi:hypothetical protein
MLSYQGTVYWNTGDVQAAFRLHRLAYVAALAADDRDALTDLCLEAGQLALATGQGEVADAYMANSLRFMRQVGHLSDLASRTNKIGEVYQQFGSSSEHRRKGFFLPREAHRLYELLGSSKRGDTWASTDVLAGIRYPDLVKETPAAADLLTGSYPWPLPELSMPLYPPGSKWVWWAVAPETLDECRKSPEACLALIRNGENLLERFDVSYGWEAIAFLLFGQDRVLPDGWEKDGIMPAIENNSRLAFMGNETLSEEFTVLGNRYRCLTEEAATIMARNLDFFGEIWPGLASIFYNGPLLDARNTYPGGWAEDGDNGRAYLTERMLGFLSFLRHMAGSAIVCGFWDGR